MSHLRVSLAPKKGKNVSQITIFGCTSLNMADANSVMSKDARFSLSVRSHSIAICAENLSQNTIKHLSENYLSDFFMLAFLYNRDNPLSKSWGPFWSYQLNITANSAHLA